MKLKITKYLFTNIKIFYIKIEKVKESINIYSVDKFKFIFLIQIGLFDKL